MLDRPLHLDKFGRPITAFEWSELIENTDYKRIGYDEFPATTKCEASYLSTVWMGLDHNFFPNGSPLIFETMRFAQRIAVGTSYHPSVDFPHPDYPDEQTDQVRYSTEEQARIAHFTIVRLIHEQEMQ